ncbi:MAG: hypothetical protein NZ840_01355 [Anaerolineales bacterium]|nr:hypothetical protein [Anaerolineales bacterium]MDW8160684.1 hypothetical protein [Anaerolineales bacterium]
MKTPAGKECPYFYGDYYRGRKVEECRLLSAAHPPLPWKPSHCYTCPVPEIRQANACSHMELRPRLIRPFPFLRQEVKVTAYCTKIGQVVTEPFIGCGECHPLPFALFGEDDEANTAARP